MTVGSFKPYPEPYPPMLSDRQIQAALKRCENEVTLNDGAGGHGTGSLVLIARRRQSGVTAQWVGRWWVDNRQRKKTLGRYPDVPLQRARELFDEQVRGVLSVGRNPAAMAVAAERPTVQRLFSAYCDRMAADGKSSAVEVRRCLGFAADHFGANKLAADIHASDVSAYLATIYGRGAKVAADRVRSYLSAAFNFGLKSSNDYRAELRQDWGIQSNPVAAVQKDNSASQPRDRALTAKELAVFWHALDQGGFALETRAALRLMICCGQRLRETLRMEAHEVDLDAKVWHIPAPKTKGKRFPHSVPLPPLAVATIKELLKVHRAGVLMPIQDHSVTTAVMRWLDDASMAHFQVRDLRRTWKTRAADAGLDRFTRDLIQQHAKLDTGSKHYDRADYLPLVTDAMAKWGVWLEKCLQSTDG